MATQYTLAELAKAVGGAVRGDATVRIRGVRGVAEAGPHDIAWISHEKYAREIAGSKAGAVLVDRRFGETPMPAILVDDPALAMIAILGKFALPAPQPEVGVHPTAVVAETAGIADDARIGPHVVVGDRARIGPRCVLHGNVFVGADAELGEDCVLWPGVVVRERCVLGRRVMIHPNATVGADGFGYHFHDGKHHKIPQIGTVEIGDDVEIDRAKFGTTRIGPGTKIDNLAQIAHNVQIGPGCIIVAQVGIAGSTRLGSGVVLGGKVGVRDHVRLGDGLMAAACSCISKDFPAGAVINGIPAIENDRYLREQGNLRRLPELADKIKDLIKRVEQLESSTDHP
jgi:UDP-3-O-[3-hydroxymyristoyl] glucosamine N-acyltransferase